MSTFQRGPQGKRRDAKSITMNKFTALDEDIASRYDYDDEEPEVIRRTKMQIDPVRFIREAMQARKDRQMLRSTGGQQRNKQIVFQVTVRGIGKGKMNKEYVLKALHDAVEEFKPIAPVIDNNNLTFYVIEKEEAEAVKSMSRRITERNRPANKYMIIYRSIPAPWEVISPKIKQLIQEALQGRYIAGTNTLDLSDFASDKVFTSKGVHAPLFQNGIMIAVAEVVREKYAGIRSLSLKGNRLRSLDFASSLAFRAPNVKELDLSSNSLTRIEELEKIRGWPVESLHIENNGLCQKYTDGASYTSAVHEYFPRVTYLDGITVQVNPFKLNEVAQLEESGLPPIRPGFCRDEGTRSLVETFLSEYFNLYDGQETKTRENLIGAYDDDATFTYSIHVLPDAGSYVTKGDDETFKQYLRSSHNIIHMEKWRNYREKIVYRGSMDVAVQLKNMPPTQHIAESFILDFTFVSEALMAFTLQGLFRDGADAFAKDGSVKFFVRNFVVVPKGPGYVSSEANVFSPIHFRKMAIISDILSITPVNVDRIVRYRAMLKKAEEATNQPQPGPSGVQAMPLDAQMAAMGSSSNPPPTPQPEYDRADPQIQAAMVDQFSQQSGMKAEWSRKCLEDQNWDFEAAGRAFLEVRDKIPREAFA
ncbi:TAP domain-containing protein [Aphelenchoides avenae]|nr:TAP domain-containing protein [Aphelenchus avenae]